MDILDLYIINLDETTDRMENINRYFKNNFNIKRINGIKHNIGRIGCFLSHKKCIEYAKNNKLKYIIVLEDDCKPNINKFTEKLNEILLFLNNNNDWNIFLGGSTNIFNENIIKKYKENNNNYFLVNKAKTTHFIIYNSNCYDFFLNCDETIEDIDTIWHYKLKALVIIPFIATQSPSYSNILNDFADYTKKFNLTERRLLKLL